MTKVDIRRLDSVTTNDTTATQLINENFEALQEAIENTISRDGTTPNFMNADLDLNSYKIINAGTPTNNTDVITKEYFDQNVGDAPGYAAAAEQAANRASTSAQAAQGYSSVATGAADVAQDARDFIESDPGFITVSTDLSLGANSEIRKVNANKTNIDTVAGSISNVNTVSTDIANVNAVAGDLTNIDSVATNMTDINNVADDLTKIVAVADDLTNIDNVADDLTKIDNVADNLTNIDAVANNTTNINAVAGNESNINAVASNESNINSVNANKTNIDAVAGNNANITAVANNATNINAVNANKTNIDAVAGNNSNIAAVANNESNINAVNANKTNIDTVAANNADISTVADDIANVNAVAADLTNIDAASGYAAEAKQWAIGDPTEPTGGSAKYWAGQAAAGQVQANWTEVDATSKAYILNKPTPGDNISFANNKISAVSDLSPTQNSTNLVQSGGVFTATNNLQQQIDAIVASSDVYDIVADYAALQAYDITTVPVNDIIKVLVDETHSGAATYYRCVESGGVKSWSYIGSEGAYYTKAESNTLLGAKQNTITGAATTITSSNLTASKALVSDANGKVAASSVTSTELGYLAGVTSAIQTQLGNKANDSAVVKLTGAQTIAGNKNFTGVTTIYRPYISPENPYTNEGGEIVFQGGATEPNASKVMQIDRQNGKFRFFGSDSSSNVRIPLQVDVENNAVIGVTPATSDNSTKIATTAFVVNILKAVYPVGSCFIGTTSTCPLASFFGTWTLKSTGIVTSVDSNVPVKGNGKALGLTNGSTDYSLGNDTGTANGRHTCLYEIFSNSSLPATSSNATISTNNALFGVNTDDTKSGIVGTVTRSTLSVNIWERTA